MAKYEQPVRVESDYDETMVEPTVLECEEEVDGRMSTFIYGRSSGKRSTVVDLKEVRESRSNEVTQRLTEVRVSSSEIDTVLLEAQRSLQPCALPLLDSGRKE